MIVSLVLLGGTEKLMGPPMQVGIANMIIAHLDLRERGQANEDISPFLISQLYRTNWRNSTCNVTD